MVAPLCVVEVEVRVAEVEVVVVVFPDAARMPLTAPIR
jgi:hypothetical protein